MSKAATTVRRGFFLLKPSITVVERGRRAEVVEWTGRKPCWWSAGFRWVVRSGRRRRSRTLTIGERREMGRYEDAVEEGFLGLRMGMMVDWRQEWGI